MKIDEKTTVNELFTEAKKLLADVPAGTTFMVKDLFRGYEWNAVPIGLRIRLGALFLAYAEGEGAAEITVCPEKSKQNQQKYTKK